MKKYELMRRVEELQGNKEDIESDLEKLQDEKCQLLDELDNINALLGRAEEELSLYI